ncbi:hypothetical protein F4677DRAFT_458575 [Hypoxylon crocopeplum]|nr:hypothetical protein F4677DRAFT_458575 [Hypoxylon crocopeplum]
MDSSSLARLDQVSRHPLIAKGVRSIRIVLDFYAAELGEGFYGLFPYFQQKMWRVVREWRSLEDEQDTERNETARSAAIARIGNLFASWYKFAMQVPDSYLDDQDRADIQLLRRAQDLYCQAYLEQQQMRFSGDFSRAVAKAIARMPVARSLVFTDHDKFVERRSASLTEDTESPGLLIANIIRPMTWCDADIYRISSEPVEQLTQIPLVLHRAGVVLENINYQVAPCGGCARLVVHGEDHTHLKAAMQGLKSFTFWPYAVRYSFLADDDYELRQLMEFVSTCTDTDSIQDISVNMAFLWPRLEMARLSAGSLLLTREWPRLRRIRFRGTLRFSELRKFYAWSRGQVEVFLDHVRLISGSWADVLDIMRENTRAGTRWSGISSARGAEYDNMSYQQRLIGSFNVPYFDSICICNTYIRGLQPFNPFRYIGEVDNGSSDTDSE